METVNVLIGAARGKSGLLSRSPSQTMVLSMLAGVHVGFGIIVIFSIGAPLAAAGPPCLAAGTAQSEQVC